MAKTVTTDLNIKIQELNRKLDKVITQYDTMGKEIDQTKKKQGDLARQGVVGFNKLQGSVANYIKTFVGITVAITAVRKVIKTIAEFDKTLANLSAITGAVGKDLEFLKNRAIELSEASTLSAKDVVEGFKLVGSAKPELLKSGEALAEVTKQAILLSEASGLELNRAVSALTDSLNQFGVGADQASRFVNVLAAGSKFGAAEVDDLSAAIVGFGTAAATSNVGIEQAAALVELLAEKGLKGADSGIKLRNVLLVLLKSTNNYKDGVFDLNLALDNLEPIMNDTIKLEKLFGKQNVIAAQAVAQNKERIDELTKSLSGTNTVLEQAEVNTDTLSDSWKRFGNQFETSVLKIDSSASFLKKTLEKTSEELKILFADELTAAEKLNFILFAGEEKKAQLLKKLNDIRAAETESRFDAINREQAILRAQLEVAKAREDFNFREVNNIQVKIDLLEKEKRAILGLDEALQEEIETAKTLSEEDKKTIEARKKANIELTNLINKINAQLVTDAEDRERAILKAEFDADVKSINQTKASEDIKNKAILARTEKMLKDKQDLERRFEQEDFDRKEAAREDEEELLRIFNDFLADQEIEKRNEIERAKREAISMTADIVNNLFQNQSNLIERQRQLEIDAATEAANLEQLKGDARVAAQEDLTERIDQINAQFAEEQKQIAIKQATIDFAGGVIRIWAQKGVDPIVAAALTALLTAQFATNLALINSQSFAKGTEYAPEGLHRVGERGEELVWMPEGSKVFNNNAVNKYNDAIKAMNEGTFEDLYFDKAGIVKAAKKYEDGREMGFAQNIANSLLMNSQMKGVENLLFRLNQKENTTHVFLKDIAQALTNKKYETL